MGSKFEMLSIDSLNEINLVHWSMSLSSMNWLEKSSRKSTFGSFVNSSDSLLRFSTLFSSLERSLVVEHWYDPVQTVFVVMSFDQR